MARHDDIDERMKAIRERREEMHWGDLPEDGTELEESEVQELCDERIEVPRG